MPPPIPDAATITVPKTLALRAFANALLPALVLHILCQKGIVLMRDAEGPNLTDDDRGVIAEGIRHLRDLAAHAGDSDRLDLVRRVARHSARAKSQLQEGRSPVGNIRHTPLTNRPVHLIPTPNFVSPLRAGKSKRTRTLLKPSIAAPAATAIPP